MPLFDFELFPTIEIPPWGEGDKRHLSWFALTYGRFRINVGDHVLFRYTDEILSHWGIEEKYADYQIASFARDILASAGVAMQPLPAFLEVVAQDWKRLSDLHRDATEHDDYYEAFRWLGERSPDTGYLVACPNVSFYRIGQSVLVGWDNRDLVVDGISVWEAQFGRIEIPIDDFRSESREFSDRLLSDMSSRIENLNNGTEKAQIPISSGDLLEQHENWKEEFARYLAPPQEPDVPWSEAEVAMSSVLSYVEKRNNKLEQIRSHNSGGCAPSA